MLRFALFMSLLCITLPVPAQVRHRFTLGKKEFLLDGKPLRLISGEMHPARIPRAYWRHRIRMAKAMGCNTIAAYIFWNYHELRPGVFDFRSENRDVADFIRICQAEGMWVLLRPGPYVCAEWDFGGIPPYLLQVPDIRVRCRDPRFMNAANRYIEKLSAEIRNLQCDRGGPILMVQIENEYGSYGNDRGYLEALRVAWKRQGITVPFFTADGPTPYMLEAGTLDGAAIGLDSGSEEKDFDLAYRMFPDMPVFSSETYPGWLTHWGEKWARPDTNELKREVEYLLREGKSLNFYVIHGGTNFGFTAGANAGQPAQYQPDVTSYDYDAPIDEQGRPTAKYFMLRRLIASYSRSPLPELPEPVPAMNIPPVILKPGKTLWELLPKPVLSVQPRSFESMGQNQGLVLYRTRLIGHRSGRLTIREPHDYALVFLDGQFVDTVFRDGGMWTVDLPKRPSSDSNASAPLLEILVEGMGHINFAQFLIDRKGITDRVTLNGMTLMNWEQFQFPLETVTAATVRGAAASDRPGRFYTGAFELERTADTYFDLSGYGKGMVYVNGHNLGRYWSIGPQQRLYCPASWLRKGRNDIVIFDIHSRPPVPVAGMTTPE